MNPLRTYLTEYHRPVWTEIDLDCIIHNIREFQQLIPENTEILAVVKADAYGHGAVNVAKAALEGGASRLAVAFLEEGVLLRRAGITVPIHILGVSAAGTEQAVIEHKLSPTIFTIESARRFSAVSSARGCATPFQLKLDTGMGRIGVRPDELPAFLDALRSLSSLELEGVFSHFSKADEQDKTYTHKQLQRYHHCLALLDEAGFSPKLKYLANSAGTMETPEAHFDLVRIGISLYGMYPSDEVDSSTVALRPVMSWKTRIAHLKTVPPGEALSYGGMFVTQRPTVVATLPVGYADGFRRRLWTRDWQVLVRGQRAPVIGKICMDMCLLDVTDVPETAIGDDVVLLGTQGQETISADEMACALDTIHYEITCLVGKRVPRVYFKGGEMIAVESLLGYRSRDEVLRFNS